MADLVKRLREPILANAFERRAIMDGALTERLIRERGEAADEIERLAARLPDREGWQDISTAPKDGTPILGWWIGTPNNCSVVWWSSAYKAWRDDAGALGAPTKWQTIVPPPAVHEQSQG